MGGFADCKPGELGKFPKTEGGAFWGKAPAGPSEVEVVIDPPEAEAGAEVELDPLEVAGAVDVVSEEDVVSEAAGVELDAAGADLLADPEVLPDALGVLGLTWLGFKNCGVVNTSNIKADCPAWTVKIPVWLLSKTVPWNTLTCRVLSNDALYSVPRVPIVARLVLTW